MAIFREKKAKGKVHVLNPWRLVWSSDSTRGDQVTSLPSLPLKSISHPTTSKRVISGQTGHVPPIPHFLQMPNNFCDMQEMFGYVKF